MAGRRGSAEPRHVPYGQRTAVLRNQALSLLDAALMAMLSESSTSRHDSRRAGRHGPNRTAFARAGRRFTGPRSDRTAACLAVVQAGARDARRGPAAVGVRWIDVMAPGPFKAAFTGWARWPTRVRRGQQRQRLLIARAFPKDVPVLISTSRLRHSTPVGVLAVRGRLSNCSKACKCNLPRGQPFVSIDQD